MSVTLVTGVPGAGKTALVVDLLANSPEYVGRPLFCMGIPELQLEHHQVPPVGEWTEMRTSPEDESLQLAYFTFPPHSVIVIDECQRVFRPRAASAKVPPEVAAFETHRHTGVDFILLTQHPNLIDSNVRKLIGRHYHVFIHALGRHLLEWPRMGEIDSKSDRVLAARRAYKPPRRVFELYKSAEAHTKIKRTIPRYVYLLVLATVLALGLGWYAFGRISGRMSGAPSADAAKNAPGKSAKASGGPATAPRTAAQYVEAQIPRIEGLPYSAPMYDEITHPVEAPYPVGCVQSAKRCKCIDQQGNTYATTPELCAAFVQDGQFIAFKSSRDYKPAEAKGADSSRAPGV